MISFALAPVAATLLSIQLGAPGYVRPSPDSLKRVLGVRYKQDLSKFEFLQINAEEWSAPYISADNARAFIGTRNGRLRAIEIASGDILWERKDMGAIGASMTEYENLLVLGSDSALVAVDQQLGREKWRVDIAGRVGGKVVRSENLVIAPVRPNGYVAVDLDGGKIKWRIKRPTPEGISVRGQGAALILKGSDSAFLGFSDGVLVSVSLETGKTKWTATMGDSREFFADVDTQPVAVAGGRKVLAASYNGGLFLLNAETGQVEWKRPVKGITALAKAGSLGLTVASTGNREVLGLYTASGKIRWRYKLKSGFATPPFDIGRGMIAFGTSTGPLTVLDATTGKPIQLLDAGSGTSVSPFYRNPNVAMLSNKGLFLMIEYGQGISISH